jgi:glycerophosphoryl diester phosphodiesterase
MDVSASEPRSGIDPIFGLERPVLFAHRGGGGEVPESTEEAFRHAVANGSDVLELDIQLTRDGEIVVWHGPSLKRVHDGRNTFPKKVKISDRRWKGDLEGRVWVVDPRDEDNRERRTDRLLLTLAEFIALVPRIEQDQGDGRRLPLNIELKVAGKKAPGWDGEDESGAAIWTKLFDILDPEAPTRKIVLASANPELLCSLRAEARRRDDSLYPTNLSWKEQLAYRRHMRTCPATLLAALLSPFLCVPSKPDNLEKVAFETSHGLVTEELVKVVHEAGGGVYAFLTGATCLLPAIDDKPPDALRPHLERLLDAGVDGLMTDFPEKVSRLLGRARRSS